MKYGILKANTSVFRLNRVLKIGLLTLVFGSWSCQKSADFIDLEAPEIVLADAESFPRSCTQIPRGHIYTFKARFVDNKGLGSFSLDIHHNFNQHSHSTEAANCPLDEKKTPIKPFVEVITREIPNGSKEYLAEVEFTIPSDVDTGDYHFSILLTDQAGWSTRKSLSIKIID